MASLRTYLDAGSLLVILLTFVLFLVALFLKGFTHDMLLEAGVFLVSVKLIIMSYKNGLVADRLKDRLDEIQSALRR
jgi:hypothetical protein